MVTIWFDLLAQSDIIFNCARVTIFVSSQHSEAVEYGMKEIHIIEFCQIHCSWKYQYLKRFIISKRFLHCHLFSSMTDGYCSENCHVLHEVSVYYEEDMDDKISQKSQFTNHHHPAILRTGGNHNIRLMMYKQAYHYAAFSAGPCW